MSVTRANTVALDMTSNPETLLVALAPGTVAAVAAEDAEPVALAELLLEDVQPDGMVQLLYMVVTFWF